jgi:hypothetical protein
MSEASAEGHFPLFFPASISCPSGSNLPIEHAKTWMPEHSQPALNAPVNERSQGPNGPPYVGQNAPQANPLERSETGAAKVYGRSAYTFAILRLQISAAAAAVAPIPNTSAGADVFAVLRLKRSAAAAAVIRQTGVVIHHPCLRYCACEFQRLQWPCRVLHTLDFLGGVKG